MKVEETLVELYSVLSTFTSSAIGSPKGFSGCCGLDSDAYECSVKLIRTL